MEETELLTSQVAETRGYIASGWTGCGFNSRLIIKSIPMIPLINTLQIAKRTIKSATLIASFLLPFGKEGAQIINLCFRELIIFYICRQHGSDISVIVPFQKSITFLADVFFFVYNWCIDK